MRLSPRFATATVAAACAVVLLIVPASAPAKPVAIKTATSFLAEPVFGGGFYFGVLSTQTVPFGKKKKKKCKPTFIGGDGKPLATTAKKKCKKKKRQAEAADAENDDSIRQVQRALEECLDGRVVQVFHFGFEIGTTLSRENGNWEIRGPAPPVGDPVTAVVAPRQTAVAACRSVELTVTYPTS
jgi:hypothetical protein